MQELRGWGKAPTGRHGPPLGTSGSASKPEGPSLCGGEKDGPATVAAGAEIFWPAGGSGAPPLGRSGSASKPEGPSLCGGEKDGPATVAAGAELFGPAGGRDEPFLCLPRRPAGRKTAPMEAFRRIIEAGHESKRIRVRGRYDMCPPS